MNNQNNMSQTSGVEADVPPVLEQRIKSDIILRPKLITNNIPQFRFRHSTCAIPEGTIFSDMERQDMADIAQKEIEQSDHRHSVSSMPVSSSVSSVSRLSQRTSAGVNRVGGSFKRKVKPSFLREQEEEETKETPTPTRNSGLIRKGSHLNRVSSTIGKKIQLAVFNSVLDPKETAQFMSVFKSRKIVSGQQIITAGEPGEKIIIIVSGSLHCMVNGKTIITKGAGELINNEIFDTFLSARKSYNNPFDVLTAETSEVAVATVTDLMKFCNKAKFAATITPRMVLFARSTILSFTTSYVSSEELKPDQQNLFLELFKYIHLKKGDVLFNDLDNQKEMFVVVSGALVEYLDYDTDVQKTVDQYGPGQIVGEYTLGLNLPQTNTAVAASDTIVLSLHERDFEMFLELYPELKENWRESFNRSVKREVIKHFKRLNVAFLADFKDDDFEKLAEIATLQPFKKDTAIFTQGDEKPQYFYIISKGSCEIRKDHEIIGKLEEKSNFGESVIVNDEPRASTVVALQSTVVLCKFFI
eukprot:Pgem_evm1s292